jgi:predicted DNA-binding protein with PD1-like motif
MPMPMAVPLTPTAAQMAVGMSPSPSAVVSLGAGAHLASPMLVHVLRLPPGADLMVSLEEFVRRMRARAVCILSACGSLTRVHLRFANVPDAQAAPLPLGHYEVVSLSGMMSCDSGSHVHMSVSDSTGRTLGGHLQPRGSIVYTTMEIALGLLPAVEFAREPDATFGYNELVVYPSGTAAMAAGSVMSLPGGGLPSGLVNPNVNGIGALTADAGVAAAATGSKRKVSEGEDKAGKKAKAATGKKAKEKEAAAAAAAQAKEEPGLTSEEKKPPALQLSSMPMMGAASVHSPSVMMTQTQPPFPGSSAVATAAPASIGIPSPSSSSAVTPSTSPAPGGPFAPAAAAAASSSPSGMVAANAQSTASPSPSPAAAAARPAVGMWSASQFSIFLKSLHLDHLVAISQSVAGQKQKGKEVFFRFN